MSVVMLAAEDTRIEQESAAESSMSTQTTDRSRQNLLASGSTNRSVVVETESTIETGDRTRRQRWIVMGAVRSIADDVRRRGTRPSQASYQAVGTSGNDRQNELAMQSTDEDDGNIDERGPP